MEICRIFVKSVFPDSSIFSCSVKFSYISHVNQQPRIDPEIKRQFKKIWLSLFIWVVWLNVNMVAGVVFDLGFFDDPHIPVWAHVLFFIWFLSSFLGMSWITYHIWGRTFPISFHTGHHLSNRHP